MENDIKSPNYENLIDMNEYFKLDFAKENIKGNRKFEEFKKQRLKELGKDAKLFHCKNDNVLFFVSKFECTTTLPYYYKQCPLCENYVCYFCERNSNAPERRNCCIKLYLYYFIFNKGFASTDEIIKLLEEDHSFLCLFILVIIADFIIPFLYIVIIYLFFFDTLYIGLLLSDKLLSNKNLLPDKKNTYGRNIKKNPSFRRVMVILFLISVYPIVVLYGIINAYINIFVFIISLFTKFSPFKYFLGMMIDSISSLDENFVNENE